MVGGTPIASPRPPLPPPAPLLLLAVALCSTCRIPYDFHRTTSCPMVGLVCPVCLCLWVLFPWGGGKDSASSSDHDPGILAPLTHRELGVGTVSLLVGTSFFLSLTVFFSPLLSSCLSSPLLSSLILSLSLLSPGLFFFSSILLPTSPFTLCLLILCLSHLLGGGIKAFIP